MTDNTEKKPINWTRRTAIAGAIVAAIGAASLGAAAVAKDHRPGGGFSDQMGGGFGHHGHGGWMGDSNFMQKRLNRVLDKVDATDDQKQKIKAIFEKASASMKDMRGEPGQMREEMAKLLKAPTIDRNAVEALVASRAEKRQEASKTMTTALLDAADVLTPEQRVKIADAMERHGPRW